MDRRYSFWNGTEGKHLENHPRSPRVVPGRYAVQGESKKRPAIPEDPEGHFMPGILRPRFYGQATLEAIAVGLPLGLFEIHSKAGDWFDAGFAFFLVSLLLGLRHGGRAWQAWGPLGFCLYLTHRVAIAHGYRPPYVEEDADAALSTFFVLWPTGFGLGLGMLVRVGISALVRTSQKREEGAAPELSIDVPRRTPLTLPRLMLIIALISVNIAAARMLLKSDAFFGFGTIYAPGYSERRFHRIRVGMTCAEVEAIMGRPLDKVDWSFGTAPKDREMWRYSKQHNALANCWRRWVLFEKGKVLEVVSDFWVD
jgi:hypothetical protein